VEVTGWVEDPDTYPMAAKRHSIEYLREVAHLRPRTNLIGAVARVRHTLAQALHRFFDEQGFFWVSTPLITASDTEGAGEMFRVSTLDLENLPRNDQGKVDFDKDFFGKESFLTVSGQLNGETYACALSKIYTFGPTFRAENSNTSRHLAEFWMLEPEVAFANLNDVAAWRKRCSSTSLKRYWKSARTTCSSSPSALIKTLSTVCSVSSPLILPRWITPTPSPFWKTAASSSRTRFTGAWISPPSTNVTWLKNTSKRRWW
jgi:aspartyl/asparaginyl-tRNA synthetase